jgi:capsular polysaccharide export protein
MGVDKARAELRSCQRMKQHQAVAARMSRKTLRHPLLATFLRNDVRRQANPRWNTDLNDPSILWVDDAFVSSMRPRPKQSIYGIMVDSSGSGYSDLHKALDSGSPQGWMRTEYLDPSKASALMSRYREIGVSKYNWFADECQKPSLPTQSGILVDTEDSNLNRILLTAFESTESAPIYLRVHPHSNLKKINARISSKFLGDARIQYLSPALSPAQCFSFCHTVMVENSLLGMEALIHGKHVITSDAPFFAGRGLTEDFSPLISSSQNRSMTLLELFDAAYLKYCHYFDPDSEEPCGLGDILDHIELQKDMYRRNRGHWVAVGFSPWNRSIASDYLQSPANEISEARDMSEIPQNSRILVWGRKIKIPENLRNRTVWVEDGFIRSKGLGAAFNFPYSWVIDESGIYFDCSTPSDLENIYGKTFESSDLTEANEIIRLLREKRLTKYNLEVTQITLDQELIQGRKRILVPGQVDADASIMFGSPEVKSNLELLQRVRTSEPDAFIIFKAHPDLVAAARHGKILTRDIEAVADIVVTEGNVLDWLDQCDEVHTMTSTVGFEALIRNVPVVTYGLPFYAGWGLTKDHLTCERRNRKLTLEELVCGALMKYPRYLNPDTGEFTTALKVFQLLASDKVALDRRAWYLKAVSLIKKTWVKITRMRSPS